MDVEVLSNPLHIGGLWGTLPKVDASMNLSVIKVPSPSGRSKRHGWLMYPAK